MPRYGCVICKQEVAYDAPLPELRPFCSPRCRMIDLGLWFREAYSIDRDVDSDNDPLAPWSPGEPGTEPVE